MYKGGYGTCRQHALIFWSYHVSIGMALLSTLHLRSTRLVEHSTCVPLQNHEAVFTAEVDVGEPKQKLQLIADTGSNVLVIIDCASTPYDTCFKREGSNTLVFSEPENDVDLRYGGGDIFALRATDVVHFGDITTTMQDSLFLGSNISRFDYSASAFGGIMGLGSFKSDRNDYARGLLDVAGQSRFSVCMNANDAGALRVGNPQLENPLESIGQEHWTLGLEGVAVGKESAISVCNPENKPAYRQSTCAAIPDTGTTLLYGPQDGINALLEEICDNWNLCKNAHSSDQFSNLSKAEAFTRLLKDCNHWKTKSEDLYNLPSIFFHLTGGRSGQQEIMELTGWAYILENEDGCHHAFSIMDYSTEDNGYAWILGLPAFMEHTVTFDSAHPASISFSERNRPCQTCEQSLAGIHATRDSGHRTIRRIIGKPRRMHIDVSQPL